MSGPLPEPARIPLRWRLAALLSGLALGAAAVVLATEHHSTRAVLGRLSAVAVAGLLVAAGGAAALLALAVCPRRWLRKLRFSRSAPPQPSSAPWLTALAWIALVVVGATVAVAGIAEALRTPPSPDEEHFVHLAEEIANGGGVAYLLPALLGGKWAESNRHPLFPLLLSIYPERWFALGVSSLAYFASLGVLYLMLSRLLSCSVQALWGVCVAASASALVAGATSALADMLLAFWVLSCWYLTFLVNRERRTTRAAFWAVLAGVAFGFGYLTKATAILWCVPVLLGAFRFRLRGVVALILAFGAALLVASPLLIRNARLFGNPLYNFNQRFLFTDTFEEGMTAQPRPLSVAARQFLGRHGWRGVAWRQSKGLAWELFIVSRGAGPCGPELPRLTLGAAAILCGAVGFLSYWSKGYSGWLGATVVLAWLSFGWYTPIAASARFVLPAVALFSGFAPAGLTALAAALGGNRMRWIAAGALLWCALTAMALVLDPLGYLPRL